ncbi:hypothetical protein CGCF415_v002439 [Colletotrichum fructicola]|uniref:Uncharacterized protein n=1 Tax=Colletotrichum fructicola (strain Nara gc5) TaxID=1213859 RepID=A0A7J6J7X9_COLFN|nr:uncharacterized protein CGMCC3_g688 [Colletotrichum fructicola]KAF4485961.1 hypothetical protein CGGC5_v005281 [Colletotrichum fructicola Nara gc5]KAE9583444.1 hypothetical protein CGMCC3_g688 [Colletotrichum fructicola]KAF4433548.1 hypothetical protein CFRS1_v011630 [Colletotrichum fructicola]KAF4894370.1 hypothetical protein CGCFRS4_v006544 [Colletotrichum fructicola]KAF4914062.1 hypothetical protein CGCF415_v002439 [Colletotrichum fructicola]
MPTLRGIDVSVVLNPTEPPLPELPHPDASSVSLRGLKLTSPTSSPASSLHATPEKCRAQSTVYIPSAPGAQFHIRYGINRPPADARYLYFRLVMNGRPVASWGIKSQTGTIEIVSHALYVPDNKWTYRESGMVYRREGVEKRFFHFTPHSGKDTPAAMDGGLVELQVFRSKGRKRRSPELADFRNQDAYGITSPTGGLIETPQDLTYYDWRLVDAVDIPYATFRFFYRTWCHLKELNLVPESLCNELIASSGFTEETTEETPPDTLSVPAEPARSSETTNFAFDPADGSVFGSGVSQSSHRRDRKAFKLPTPPKLMPPKPARLELPQPSKLSRDIRQVSDLARPLPPLPDIEVPIRRPSLESSRAPSVTPSLQTYADESSGADEIELGVARRVVLPQASKEPGGTEQPLRPLPAPPTIPPSPSDYDTTPPSSGGSKAFKHIGRQEYLVGTTRQRGALGFDVDAPGEGSSLTIENFSNISISEGEWFRSPSPLRRKRGRVNLNGPNAPTTLHTTLFSLGGENDDFI